MKASLPDKLRLPAMTLAAHAYEHKRASGIMSDQTAERWYAQLSQQYENIPLPDVELTNGIVTRSMVIDYALLDFIIHNQPASIIDLGCGFSTRRSRLYPMVYSWTHVDLPEVLETRLSFQPVEDGERLIRGDLTDFDSEWTAKWMADDMDYLEGLLFIVEGVLNHLSKEHAKAVLRLLHERYRGARVIGTVITENGLKGAQSQAAYLGFSKAMWAVEGLDEFHFDFLGPLKSDRVWLLGKVASRIGLIRPATADEASGLVFMATL